MFIKLTNGTPEAYTIGQLRRDNPNTSFPKVIPLERLEQWNIFPLVSQTIPDHNRNTHKIVKGEIKLIDSVWTQTYSVEKRDAESVSDYMRKQRDRLLAETDWTALSDVAMTAEMATYRQALRDITEHANFPYLEDADWPVKP